MEADFYPHYFEIEGRHWWFRGRTAIFSALLDRQSLPPRGETKILDFGCGTGAFLETLDRYGEVHAVDGDRAAVDFCHQRGRDEVLHVPPGAPIPFPDATFDLVTALDVVEHIEDDVAAVAEFRRVLKPGGVLLVAVPAFMELWGDQDEISQHFRRYRRLQLESVVREAGLSVDHSSYFNSALFPPIAAIRVIRRRVRGARADKTDFSMGPEWINELLARLFSREARRLGAGRTLPFGVSAFVVARR